MSTAELPDFAKKRLENVKTEGMTSEQLELSKALQVFEIPVDLCIPSAANPNEMDEEAFNMLAEEIDESREGSPGFIEPIHVVPLEDGTYRIIGGEHRWKARKALGKKTVPGFVLSDVRWKDEEFQEFMLLRLNNLHGRVNVPKFKALYDKHAAKYGNEALQRLYAFADKEYWISLTGGVKQSLRDMGAPPEMLAELEEKTKEVKTVDNLASVLNNLFQKYGNDLQWDFLVFVFGGKDHVMIRMSPTMAKNMEQVKKFCREHQVNINLLFEPIVANVKALAEDEKFMASIKKTGDEDDFEEAGTKRGLRQGK